MRFLRRQRAESQETCSRCKGTGRLQEGKGFLKMAQTCRECGGKGKKTTATCKSAMDAVHVTLSETIKVKIPAGADNGSVVRLRGKGNAGKGGACRRSADRDRAQPHPIFRKEGKDINVPASGTFGRRSGPRRKIEVPYP
jgi:molecular chaperone DnaJ